MLNGKTAVITGAARGIGKTIALHMAKEGADIALIDYCSEEDLQAACKEICACGVKAVGYHCNVADFEETKEVTAQVIGEFNSVDILVNNAGITKDNLLLRMSESEFDSVISVNLKGAFNLTKHFSRYLMKSPAGRIINISSVVGLMGNAGQANYSASKAGLIGLTKSTAKEFASRKVTCNAIAPGFIQTAMTDALSPETIDQYKAAIPLKELGTADDIANTAIFLASDRAAYITGEVIRVDGGMCM